MTIMEAEYRRRSRDSEPPGRRCCKPGRAPLDGASD